MENIQYRLSEQDKTLKMCHRSIISTTLAECYE